LAGTVQIAEQRRFYRKGEQMKEINENEFSDKTSNGVVLIDFGAEWCGPCKTLLPILEKVSKDYEGKMNIYSVDIDRSPSLAARHGVMSVPTMLVFKDGRQIDRMVGLLPERELKKRIDGHLGAA
jgi:thioredoxin